MKARQILTFLYLAALVCIAGCASGLAFQPASAPPPDAARVYVYRLKHYNPLAGVAPNATPYIIKLNDGRVIELSNGGYASFLAKPGQKQLDPKWNTLSHCLFH